MQTCTLLNQIETCREEMIRLSKSHGMSSDEVIECSIKLDYLLNKYQQPDKTKAKEK